MVSLFNSEISGDLEQTSALTTISDGTIAMLLLQSAKKVAQRNIKYIILHISPHKHTLFSEHFHTNQSTVLHSLDLGGETALCNCKSNISGSYSVSHFLQHPQITGP